MSALEDGGPAFPIMDLSQNQATGETTLHQFSMSGMSKRELFAAILMQREFAERDSDEIMGEIATSAVQGADALLCALAEPKDEPVPAPLTYNAWVTPAVEHRAIQSLALHPHFADMPAVIRNFVQVAVVAIANTEDGIPF